MPIDVSDNLEAFAKHLIEIIEKKPERLLNAFKEVQKEYDGAKAIPILGWLYAYTRGRSEDLQSAIDQLSSFDTPLHRLNAFQNFILSGLWTTSSSNTLLLTVLIGYGLFNDEEEIIYEIALPPKYENYQDSFIFDILIPKIRKLLIKELPQAISEQEERLVQEEKARIEAAEREQAEKERREQEEKERLEQQLARERMLKTVEFFDEPASAQAFVRDNPEKWGFQFSCKERPPKLPESKWIWRLTWHDSAGKANLIVPNRAVQELLDKIPETSLLEKNINAEINKSPALDEIKLQCISLVEERLKGIKLLVQPSAQELKKALTTYVLVQEEEQPQLFWYDSFGKKEVVDLYQYPDILDCARKYLGFLEPGLEETEQAQIVLRLKTHLQHVRMRRGMNSLAKEQAALKNCIEKSKQTQSKRKTCIPLTIPSSEAEQNYILLVEGVLYLISSKMQDDAKRSWSLQQQQKNGGYETLDLSAWNKEDQALFNSILEENKNTYPVIFNVNVQKQLRACIQKNTKESEAQYAIGSYILAKTQQTIQGSQAWKLIYIDPLQNTISAPWETYSQVKNLVDQWPKDEGPENLDDLQIDELGKLLVKLPPPSQALQMGAFRKKLAGIIGGEPNEKVKASRAQQAAAGEQPKKLKGKPCIALAELPPEDERESNSYILTKTKENWELYYINRMKNEILVDLETFPAIGELINEWKEEPIDLWKWKLDSLSELLATLIPNPVVFKLPPGSLGKIAALYKNREAPPASSTETQECRKSENKESRAATALSDGELAAREGLFKSIRTLNKDVKDVELATSLDPVEIQDEDIELALGNS